MSALSDLLDNNQQSTDTQAGGGLLQFFSSITKGMGNRRNDIARANAAGENAYIASQNAGEVGAQSASNELNLRLKQQEEIGQQRANMAEAGTGGLNAGTNAGVLQQSEINASTQALTERYRNDILRTKYLNEANMDNYQKQVYQQNANNDAINTGLSATASLLQGFDRYQKGLI